MGAHDESPIISSYFEAFKAGQAAAAAGGVGSAASTPSTNRYARPASPSRARVRSPGPETYYSPTASARSDGGPAWGTRRPALCMHPAGTPRTAGDFPQHTPTHTFRTAPPSLLLHLQPQKPISVLHRPKNLPPSMKNAEMLDVQYERDKAAFDRHANNFRRLAGEKWWVVVVARVAARTDFARMCLCG